MGTERRRASDDAEPDALGRVVSAVQVGPVGRRRAEDDSPLCSHWSEAYVALDAQLRAVELMAKRAENGLARAHVERRIPHLVAARDALHEMHHGVADERSRPYQSPGSPLVAYLVASHLWCRETLENLRRHVTQARASATADDSALTEQSKTYVADYLEPLYRELVETCEAFPDPAHPLQGVRRHAERVHSAIARLSWISES